MKKRLLTILVLAVMLVSFAALGTAYADGTSYATVTSANGFDVRLREGPSKNYAVKTKYPVGTVVEVLQRGSDWSQIQVGSTVGWMMNGFLEFGKGGSSSSSGSTNYSNAYVISGNGLRVWLRASAGGVRLQLYSAGTPLTILTYGKKWCYISINGSNGYMMTEFIHYDSTPAPAKKVIGVSVNYLDPYPDDVLTAAVNPAEATVSYSWTVDDIEYSTSSSLTVLSRFAEKPITVKVTGTGEYTGSATFTTNAVASDPWLKSVKLSNSAPLVGETLSAVLNPSSAKVEYSWRSNGVEVSTDPTYTVADSDLGKLIQLKVTGLGNVLGSASDTAEEAVASNKKLSSVTLNNTTPVVGTMLSATVTPAGMDVSYVWKVEGVTVSTAATYVVTANDLGSLIEVTATALEPSTGTASASTERVAAKTVSGVALSTSTPVVGDVIEATATPIDLTVSYEWYLDGEKISGETSSRLPVLASYEGHTIYAVAIGSGVNGGRAESRTTASVVAYPAIASVKLNNTRPVLGDVLQAEVTFSPEITDPTKRADLISTLTFVWNVNTETADSVTQFYNVKASDAGKAIRVTVKGTGNVTGSATTAYSSKVASTAKLTGVTIHNQNTGANAGSEQPEVGETLEAAVYPVGAEGHVEYNWWCNKEIVSTTNSYTVRKEDEGKNITLVVKGQDMYTGQVEATTKLVYNLAHLDVNLTIPAPVRGITPVTSVKGYMKGSDGKDKEVLSASIQWGTYDGDTFTVGELDSFGTYLPGTKYDAKLTLSIASGYSTVGGTIRVNGTPIDDDKLTRTVGIFTDFPETESDMPVNEYFITAIPAPVAGEKAVTSFSADQYTATVEWTKGVAADRTIEAVEEYEAIITLTPKTGYAMANVPENAFTVSTADSTSYTAGGNIMVAQWQVERSLTISTDLSVVTLDGSSDRLVICSASLDHYSGDLSGLVEWTVGGDIVKSNTAIGKTTGLLTIDKAETVGKELTVSGTVTIGGKTYTGTRKVTLSGGSVDHSVSVVFEKVVKTVYAGDTGIQFKAYAVNSNKGVEYHLLADNVFASGTTIGKTDGMLNVASDEKAESLTVVACAVEDNTVIAKWEVAVVHAEPDEDKLLSVLSVTPSALTGIEAKTSKADVISMLPTSVGVSTELGTVSALPIDSAWTSDDYDETNPNGKSYTFKSKLVLPTNVKNEFGLDLNVEVQVYTKNLGAKIVLKSVEPIAAISAANGTPASELSLPATVTIEVKDINSTDLDYTVPADVSWDLTGIVGYDPAITEAAQTFVVKGMVILPADVENPNEVSRDVSITVTVKKAADANNLTNIDWASLTAPGAFAYGSTESEIINGLPTDVQIEVDNLDMMNAHLSWTLVGFDSTMEDEYNLQAVPTLSLPTGIKNPDNESLTGSGMTVTVKAKPAQLTMSIGTYNAEVFQGDSTGFDVLVRVENIGSETASGIKVSVSGAGYSTSSSVFDLAKGEYKDVPIHVNPSEMAEGWRTGRVTATYEGGLVPSVTDTIDVNVIPKINIVIEASPSAHVQKGETVTMVAYVTGGVGGYTYEWEGNPEWNTAELTDTPVATAAYTLKVKDAAGHEASEKFEVLVTDQPLGLSISATQTENIVPGTEITLKALPTGGTGVYHYLWETKDTTDSIKVTVNADCTYTVQVSDGVDTKSVTIMLSVQ